MLLFEVVPDPVFLVILHEALAYVREVHLLLYREGYRPSRSEREELDQQYAELFPELAPFLTRARLVRVLDRLLSASRDTQLYRLTDYHWLIIYVCLKMYCDLHNDGTTGTGDVVGLYEIERIDFDAMVDRFFFDTDFLLGKLLLQAEERAPGSLMTTGEAWKIAAGLRPTGRDLTLVRLRTDSRDWSSTDDGPVPKAGYVGPYPLREPPDDE
jgi:hypothetical protein